MKKEPKRNTGIEIRLLRYGDERPAQFVEVASFYTGGLFARPARMIYRTLEKMLRRIS